MDSSFSKLPLDGHYATPGKLLVELAAEAELLPLMVPSELAGVFSGVIRSERLDMPTMLEYSFRKRNKGNVLRLVSPVSSQNVEM